MFNKFLLILIFCISTLSAENVTPQIFSDNMVLQRGIQVPVWGWTEPGTQVTVNFADQTHSALSDKNGKWMLKLDKMSASKTPQDMQINIGGQIKVIKNILVGEVWLCSGQSNMQLMMVHSANPSISKKFRPISRAIKKEMDKAKDPLLRQISVGRVCSPFEGVNNISGKWLQCEPKSNPFFTAAGYYFAKELRRELDVPVGLIVAAWGATRVQSWIPKNAYKNDQGLETYYNTFLERKLDQQKNWDRSKLTKFEETLKTIKDPAKRKLFEKNRPLEPIMDNKIPGTIYNGMIHPVIPYAIKGAIWYQGESNVKHLPNEYGKFFAAMIQSWRENWGQGEFPFYFVQLANFRKAKTHPVEVDNWATICNEQRLTLALENTGMSVSNDIGEPEDIHPHNKVDVGKRLSLWALAKDYGFNNIVYSGPLYKSSQFKDDKVIITFDHFGSGLMVAEKHLLNPTREIKDSLLKGFQICGADRKWQWASAKIVSKNSIEVFHASVSSPVEVRYAWSENPEEANLYNREGLPTSVFNAVKK